MAGDRQAEVITLRPRLHVMTPEVLLHQLDLLRRLVRVRAERRRPIEHRPLDLAAREALVRMALGDLAKLHWVDAMEARIHDALDSVLSR